METTHRASYWVIFQHKEEQSDSMEELQVLQCSWKGLFWLLPVLLCTSVVLPM